MAERVDHNEARRRANALGLIPAEPYPGDTSTPWLLKCPKCGRERRVQVRSFSLLRQGCACLPAAPTAEEAEAEIRRAGYVPLEDYPGALSKGWPVVCIECGRTCKPTLGKIRNGDRCRHGRRRPQPRGPARRSSGVERRKHR